MSFHCVGYNWLMVRSNGAVPCGPCDMLNSPLGRLSADSAGGDLLEIFNGPEMRVMRRKLYYNDELPAYCRGCRLWKGVKESEPLRELALQEISRGGVVSTVGDVHLEVSNICNLQCPGCALTTQGSKIDGDRLMPEWLFGIVVNTLLAMGGARSVTLFGRGESILHPLLPKFVQTLKGLLPATALQLDTNANAKFDTRLSVIDSLYCSIDGYNQTSYEQYRRGGDYERATQFVADARSAGGHPVWKYILFDGITDTDEALKSVVSEAIRCGAEKLYIIKTFWGASDGSVRPSVRPLVEVRAVVDGLSPSLPVVFRDYARDKSHAL